MILRNKIFILLLMAIFIVSPRLPAKEDINLTANSAIIMDEAKGSIIYSKNLHKRRPAASTAKILTAIIVIENLDLDGWAKISKRAVGITPTKAELTYGEKYRIRDLLKAFLMRSIPVILI